MLHLFRHAFGQEIVIVVHELSSFIMTCPAVRFAIGLIKHVILQKTRDLSGFQYLKATEQQRKVRRRRLQTETFCWAATEF